MDPKLLPLVLLPFLMICFFMVFTRVMERSDERSYRRGVKNRIGAYRNRCEKMRRLIENAIHMGGTTPNGIDGANRLIKGAEGSINDAAAAVAEEPQDKKIWRSADDSLKIARELLDKVPAAIADAPGGKS